MKHMQKLKINALKILNGHFHTPMICHNFSIFSKKKIAVYLIFHKNHNDGVILGFLLAINIQKQKSKWKASIIRCSSEFHH